MATIKEYLYPIGIKKAFKVENSFQLLNKDTLQIGLAESSFTTIEGNGYLILDFGKEICGGIRILTYNGRGKLRIRLGESLSEASSEIGENNSTNDHSTRDEIVSISDYSDMEFLQSGFRFARIDLISNSEVKIKKIVASFTHTDKIVKAKFETNDSELNQIFKTAERTLTLNIQNDMIWDGIKRDRLVWIGDIHPEMLAGVGLYEKTEFIENSLEFIANQTIIPEWMNGIPMYSMWWLIILYDYYFHTGNLELLYKYKDFVTELSKSLIEKTLPNGSVDHCYNFIDWATKGSIDEIIGVEALNYWALNSAYKILGLVNVNRDFLFNFISNPKLLSREAKISKQCASLRVMNNLPQDKAVLLNGGAKGLSTFMSFYILSAIGKVSDEKIAFDIMREYYGGMLKLSATTFWEDFDISWLENACPIDSEPQIGQIDVHKTKGAFCYAGYRHSLCHGWSAGVIPYLQKKIIGVTPLEAGFKTIAFNPRCDIINDVNALLPSPFGDIIVNIEKGKANIEVPKGVKVERYD